MLVGSQWFLSHFQQFDPMKETLLSVEQVAGKAKELVSILWKGEKYIAPTSI
jgi:hypothetical protein